ncbi:uracil-DNA glycosylase [Aquabacterium fontiphilum]|uniref:uracil-DNA glycosylase n=1 Tax=Aquabacterium fontiphilum TaxID=450365 RepID=UPI001378B793|nr:uracil-DNA glycosylase [Aquabacterium fontiphilum]NBD21123.1 uracil-DNA glycosylase [Aquabacterium fontiphilum]
MRWTERQQAMLREMGVGFFWPDSPSGEVADAPAPAQAVSASAITSTLSATPPATPAGAPRPTAARAPAPVAAAVAVAEVLPQRPDVAGLDWVALREAVQACRACGLCSQRQQAVFGVGHPQAQWMIVGEAPGEQEDRQGEPFVGRAGQLLDRMLHAVGLTRQDAGAEQQVYIANVIKCRPPANRNPQPDEVAQCAPYLARQMALVQPRIVLAMGRFAAQTVLRTGDPIGRLRGRVHRLDSGVPVVVTYHPAYLLRNPADKALVWDDLCLAREVLAQQSA